MFKDHSALLTPSRENFAYAYQAIRLERRYIKEISCIMDSYASRAPAIFAIESLMLEHEIGSRIEAKCTPELYRAVASAMSNAVPTEFLSTPQRVVERRKHGIPVNWSFRKEYPHIAAKSYPRLP
ncbi:hypothetical protein GR138_18520 [Shinella kummerowiae]|uniref:Uncharacterized protein n=1 Tax=Shinella kummerowiae TaxID=417745 RepID=A0A6N8SDR0_9HYPH|nr:hypothetical protein [Shinella kummerowiae]MXN47195.1 hypothetical protein [Shinella kummerowiae]